MSEFKAKISGMEQRASEEQKIAGTLNSLEAEIRSVRSALSSSVGDRENLKNSLRKLADKVNQHEQDMKTLRSVLINVKNNYENTERRICGRQNDPPITMDDIWNAVTTVGKGLVVSALGPGADLSWLFGTILKDEEWSGKNKFLTGTYKLGEIPKDKKMTFVDDQYVYDREKGEWVKEKKEKKGDGKKTEEEEAKLQKKKLLESVRIWSGSLSSTESLLHFGKDGNVETDWGNYTYSADVMKAEAAASAYVGLGGIGCEVGAALTAFTAGAGLQYGSDDLGVHASGQIDVGKVGTSLSGAVGLWDKNGDFNPQIGVSAKAEAIAAEVSGKAGVDIGGTEVNVKGALNVGFGAHADMGFKDGKFSFDVGVSAGVGGSVALEVDVSGTINKAVEHAKDIGDAVSKAYEAASDYTSRAANAVGDVGKGIGEGFKTGFATVTGWFT